MALSSVVTSEMLSGMVKTRISNLVITGGPINHGNFVSWRAYTVSAAEILGFNHILERLARMSSSSSKDTPLELLSDDDSDEDAAAEGQDPRSHSHQRSSSSSSSSVSITTQSLLSLATNIDELQRNLQRVLSIYAFHQTGGYLLDQKGHKIRWKREHAPELSSVEKQLQLLGIRIIAIETVGEAAVGNWPDEDPSTSKDTIPEQFSCAVCKLLMYEPVTTNCGHNFCKSCLSKWIKKSKKSTCPVCRNPIAKKWRMPINKSIHNALKSLYPEQIEARRMELHVEDNERKEIELKAKRRREALTDENGKIICKRCGLAVSKIVEHRRYCTGPVLKKQRRGSRSETAAARKTEREKAEDEDEEEDDEEMDSADDDEEEDSSSRHGFEVIHASTSPLRVIGVKDRTSILHLPDGVSHLADLELKRLSGLGRSLKEFHPAVLKRMMQLDKQDAKKNMKRTSSSNDSGSERQ
jgi:hypothetical protein